MLTVNEVMLQRRPWIRSITRHGQHWRITLGQEYLFRNSELAVCDFKTKAEAKAATTRKHIVRTWELSTTL